MSRPDPSPARSSGHRHGSAMNSAGARRRFAAVAIMAVVADAVSKLAALSWLTDPIDIGLLDLRLTRNTGVAFGLAAELPAALIIVVTLAAVLLLGGAAWRGLLGPPAPAGLIFGGGSANVIDRMFGSGVVDIFDLGWWPVFNLADAFLTIGVGLMLLSAWREVPPTSSDPDRLGDRPERPSSP